MNPLLLVDFYKPHHNKMYPEGMTKLYSNLTPRKSRIPGVDKVVWFGLQHFVLEYLIKKFDAHFFKLGKNYIIEQYREHIPIDTKHIEDLHDLGYLPIEIKALPEGTLCPIGVPCLTITNTHPDHAWLVNYLETLLSCMLWQPTTSATIAYEYKKLLTKYALETTGDVSFVQWQGHDFSMRGMSSVESAILSGMGHLLSFTGTDTIPAIYQLESSYNATGLIGASVPATEHSVMCMGTKESEIETFKRLLTLYPEGILSVVSDTWDLWKVLTDYLPAIKKEILARPGKLVIRPDSGDPVDILCGYPTLITKKKANVWDLLNLKSDIFIHDDLVYEFQRDRYEDDRKEFGEHAELEYEFDEYVELLEKQTSKIQGKGVIELLWDIFGGTYVTGNDGKQYKQLDSHIGAIYGDSITLDRAQRICERLQAKGFASTNVVFGIGSFTYQYNTRDTFGFAMKATYGEVEITEYTSPEQTEPSQWTEAREIFKDPITDDGTKKSKKGLLNVNYHPGGLICEDQCTWEQEGKGLLQTVFKDGKLVKTTTLEEIRNKLKV